MEFRGDLWHQQTRVPGVSCGVVCVILRFAVLVEHRLVTDTDRDTDRQTDGHRPMLVPIWILLKQETVSDIGISWARCKSASRSRQITMPVPHHSFFYRPDALPAAQPTASKQ